MLETLFDEILGIADVPATAKRALREQAIDEGGPGTILRDFETLLEFVGDEGLRTTGKYFLLPQGKLNDLNAVMTRPVVHRLKRPQQRSLPHLQGLHLLLRASGMGIGVGSPPAGRLMLERETVDAWRGLNATERYFALLESWVVLGSSELLGDGNSWSRGYIDSIIHLAEKLRRRRTTDREYRGSLFYGREDLMAAALMELFGWVRLEYHDPAAGEGVKVAAVERLPLGDAMVQALRTFSFSDQWPRHYRGEIAAPGVLLPLFQPYFPEYQQALPQQEWTFRDGTYTWRVSLSKAWRRIVAPADLSLDDLAMTILDAFDFDADHLYCFELRQTNGRTLRVAHPCEREATVFTDETSLGDLPIVEGGTMTMVFDYGDQWHFNLELEKVTSPDKNVAGPRITAKRGKPPVQYEWDDEYE